jgi:hypothetical protein
MDMLRILTLTCGGSRTKRLITLLAVLVLPTWAQAAYADSVPTFIAQINIDIAALNQFTPFTADTTFGGPGISLNATGGDIGCDWCYVQLGAVGIDPISVDFPIQGGMLTLGGQQFDCQVVKCSLASAEIAPLYGFSVPTNGEAQFTAMVPAMMSGPLLGQPLSGQVGDSPFNIQPSPGELSAYFYLDGSSGIPFYFFGGGTFATSAPEPGTLGLMAAGLAAILGVFRRRNKHVESRILALRLVPL